MISNYELLKLRSKIVDEFRINPAMIEEVFSLQRFYGVKGEITNNCNESQEEAQKDLWCIFLVTQRATFCRHK